MNLLVGTIFLCVGLTVCYIASQLYGYNEYKGYFMKVCNNCDLTAYKSKMLDGHQGDQCILGKNACVDQLNIVSTQLPSYTPNDIVTSNCNRIAAPECIIDFSICYYAVATTCATEKFCILPHTLLTKYDDYDDHHDDHYYDRRDDRRDLYDYDNGEIYGRIITESDKTTACDSAILVLNIFVVNWVTFAFILLLGLLFHLRWSVAKRDTQPPPPNDVQIQRAPDENYDVEFVPSNGVYGDDTFTQVYGVKVKPSDDDAVTDTHSDKGNDDPPPSFRQSYTDTHVYGGTTVVVER
eukprot:GHVR01171005.1.p1 GENE.GHVR01171005.1~~GHVR01171005.1.p1  ORF type:complete len:295 (+),score=50.65 GHVR01171005.1:259-1143(+)